MKAIGFLAVLCMVGLISSALGDDLAVNITSGPGDTKQGCTVSYSASCTGGCSPYTYSWASSTGNFTGSGATVSCQADVSGSGTMTVTVTDASNNTDSDSRDYNIHKEVETTGPTTGGDHKQDNRTCMSASYTCNSLTNPPTNCTTSFTVTAGITATVGVTVTGSVDLDAVKASVAGTATASTTVGVGMTNSQQVAPGSVTAWYLYARYLQRSGTWKKYDCQGNVTSGTWKNRDYDTPRANLQCELVN